MCRRVDFPDPEGPMSATFSPAWTLRAQPRRMSSWFPPCAKVRRMSRSSRMGGDIKGYPVGAADGQIAMIACSSIIHKERFVFGVKKKDTELLAILNEGLRRLIASPFWQELISKYKSGT